MKKMISLLMICMLSLCLTAAGVAEGAETLTAAELNAAAEALRTDALESTPVNDPTAESAQTEDGTLFQYEDSALYILGSELTGDAVINAVSFADSEGPVFRGTGIDSLWSEVEAAFPLENKELAGTREAALLYLAPGEGAGYCYGRVERDGQRIHTAEYAEVTPDGNGFRKVSVSYSLLNGLVTSIRIEGLNPETGIMTTGEAGELFNTLTELGTHTEYKAVRTSLNGTELTAFGAEDLVFSGIDYTSLSPETLPGQPETELMDNGDGTWLMRCDGDGYEAVFLCDAKGKNAKILSFTILDEGMEGPRCVRLGDLFHEDFARFRSEGNEMTEEMTEALYGKEGEESWGLASYDPSAGEMSLRYVTTAGGEQIELLLKYGEGNALTEIIVHTL